MIALRLEKVMQIKYCQFMVRYALIAKNKEFILKNNIKYVINISEEIPNYFHGSLTYLNIN